MSLVRAHHIPILDPLRGLAALAVCMFHFGRGNSTFLNPHRDPVGIVASFGWLGFAAFFVISGFIIPHAMRARSYTLRDAGQFFIRRLKRLEPPYFACILVVIVLHQLSTLVPGYRGEPLDFDWPRLAAHIAYLNAVVGYKWFNPVFWSLAIEFQYYLFVALIFPLLVHDVKRIGILSPVFIAALSLLGGKNVALLPHWLPLFALGMTAFQFYVGYTTTRSFLLTTSLVAMISYPIIGLLQTLVGLVVMAAILICRDRALSSWIKPFAFLGTISYSLYLLHGPIGGRVIHLAERLPDQTLIRYAAIVLAMAVSIVAAYLFWIVVEKPSHQWSSRRVRESVDEHAR